MKERLHLMIRGAVQGVGFRPFIYRLATEMGLHGGVNNSSHGVVIEAEGPKPQLDVFILRIEGEKPPRSFIQSMESTFLTPQGYTSFEIFESADDGATTALVMPDIATCPDCLEEIFDPGNRRFLYPFTNCTNCGPRFSIIEALPYDRRTTSMKNFIMCDHCRREYDDPSNRRFHAEPNACPACGPRLELWNANGTLAASSQDALLLAANAILMGEIIAVKGIGGFHLMCDARNNTTVMTLRRRKGREEKPFALMYPNLQQVKDDCEVSTAEERLLSSPESPIVLLRQKKTAKQVVADSIAPGNPYLGVMLPYTPLHHILMQNLRSPIVATSGNLSDEPICTDEGDALRRLKDIADHFLVHNRPIVRHVDDSIARVILEREQLLRRARGYAPLPVRLLPQKRTSDAERETISILALGAHLKNTVALATGEDVFLSQHIGDLETIESFDAFTNVITSLKKLYRVEPFNIVTDSHPGYLSTQYGKILAEEVTQVQHHYAHITSCMAENQLEGSVLGVSWDGTGYGTDGSIWGGEFLLTTETSFKRVATLRPFRLPGGEKAIREPRRSAIGVLFELFGKELFRHEDLHPVKACSVEERTLIGEMLEKDINSVSTSSIGRLFDAVASLLGVCQKSSFEGQSAMALEHIIGDENTEQCYSFDLVRAEQEIAIGARPLIIADWGKMILEIIGDLKENVDVSLISAKFHNTLSEIILSVARTIGERRIVLSGGCFQNKYLTEHTVRLLQKRRFEPYWHQRVPTNDGGISLGQVYAFLRMNANRKTFSIPQPTMTEMLK